MTFGDHELNREKPTPSPTPRPADGDALAKPTWLGPGLTKLLVAFTKRHRGKALELDASRDTMRVLGPGGEELAVVNSEVALDHLLGCAPGTTAPAPPGETQPLDQILPRPKPFRVSAQGSDGGEYEGRCPVVRPNGLFLELARVPALGTELDMILVRADHASRTVRMKGTVAWACPRGDEFGLAPGVGVTCTWHSPELAAFLPAAGAPPSQ